MIYVLAAFGVVVLLLLAVRAFSPLVSTGPRRGPAPDDDPDFLRGLAERAKKIRPETPDEEPA